MFSKEEYNNWLLQAQARRELTQLPQWAVAERLDYVDSFMEWWYHRR